MNILFQVNLAKLAEVQAWVKFSNFQSFGSSVVPVVSSRLDFSDPKKARMIGKRAKPATSSRKIHSSTRDNSALDLIVLAGDEVIFVSACNVLTVHSPLF